MKLKISFKSLRLFQYLILLIVLPLISAAEDGADSLFKKGNEQFAKRKYEEAITSYQRILERGYRSAAVYFNLGNAYYRTGDIPSALLYYEKAHKLDPGDEDIKLNIQIANLKTTDKTDPVPEFFLFRWWRGLILLLSLNTLAVLSVVFFLLASLSLAVYLFTQSVAIKKASFYSGIMLIVFGATFLFLQNRQAHYFRIHHGAIIFSGSVTVKSEPDPSSKGVFVIHSGTKVGVQKKDDGWIKIKLPNGNSGWILETEAKEI